jgi:hypothetical protein
MLFRVGFFPTGKFRETAPLNAPVRAGRSFRVRPLATEK